MWIPIMHSNGNISSTWYICVTQWVGGSRSIVSDKDLTPNVSVNVIHIFQNEVIAVAENLKIFPVQEMNSDEYWWINHTDYHKNKKHNKPLCSSYLWYILYNCLCDVFEPMGIRCNPELILCFSRANDSHWLGGSPSAWTIANKYNGTFMIADVINLF